MIELRHLDAGYQGRPVLTDVSLSFPPGTVVVLVGPNGGGKSTLLKAALGLIPRTGGEILYDGVDLSRLSSRAVARQAAFLPQTRSVPNITAEKLVLHGRFPYLSYPRSYRREDREKAAQALALADASELARRPMQELSGGQRQKVYFAMTLAQETGTVFMDEPTTFLDLPHQLHMVRTARSMAEQGKAVVLVLHDLTLALRAADEIVVLAEGRVLRTGSAEDIRTSGVLEQVFQVHLGRTQTENGWQYYYDMPGEPADQRNQR